MVLISDQGDEQGSGLCLGVYKLDTRRGNTLHWEGLAFGSVRLLLLVLRIASVKFIRVDFVVPK